MSHSSIREELAEEFGDELVFIDPPEYFDQAISGVAMRCGMDHVVVYSRDAVIKALVVNDGMSVEEADEYVSFNIEGAYVGPSTPMIMVTLH